MVTQPTQAQTADVNSLIIKYKARAGNDNNHSSNSWNGENAMRAPGETFNRLIPSTTSNCTGKKNELDRDFRYHHDFGLLVTAIRN